MREEVITSRKNPLLLHLRRLASSRKYRREQGEFLADGGKLLGEALEHGPPPRLVVTDGKPSLPPLPPDTRLIRVPEDVLASLSPLDTPQGLLFVCTIPALSPPPLLEGRRYLVLDGVQDPGNVGAIWRSADALGADGLILTGPCADPWSPKTVRATMGACFRLPLWEVDRLALAGLLECSRLPLYAAALGEKTVDARSLPAGPIALAVGSEGVGLSQELLRTATGRVRIPMRAHCESLNAAAAAAILLWELARTEAPD